MQSVQSSNWLSDIYFIDENYGWLVGNEGTILKTTDGGTTWVIQKSGTINDLRRISFSII